MNTWPKTFDSDIRAYEAISMVFLNHPHLLNGFFEDKRARLRQSPEEMIKFSANYSDGEAILVKVALDIWSGSGGALVFELTEALDLPNFINVLNALIHIKSDNLSSLSLLREPIF
jgi:hypothetical protein